MLKSLSRRVAIQRCLQRGAFSTAARCEARKTSLGPPPSPKKPVSTNAQVKPPISKSSGLQLKTTATATATSISSDPADVVPTPSPKRGTVRASSASSSKPPSGPLTIAPSALSHHWDNSPATPQELQQAEDFFVRHRPSLVFSVSKLLQMPFTGVPEVAFMGRSNVGKSSLLNALLRTRICHTSSKPGRTRSMNAYAIGGADTMGNKGLINVLDMPGYGFGSQGDWGAEIEKYLVGRKELKRVFVIIDADHGLKWSDEEMLGFLRSKGIPHQVLLAKVDRVVARAKSLTPEKLARGIERLRGIFEDLEPRLKGAKRAAGAPPYGEILATSGTPSPIPETYSADPDKISKIVGSKLGVNAVRWAVLVATGLSQSQHMR